MREFVRHSAIYGLSDATLAVLSLLSTPILTRVFDPSLYGTREFIANVLTLLSPILLLGLDNAVPGLFVDPAKSARRRTYITTGLAAMLLWACVALPMTAVIAAVSAPPSLASAEAERALWIALASALPLSVIAYAKYVLRFSFSAAAFATVSMSAGILITVGALSAVTIGGLGLPGLYAGQLVGAIVPGLLAIWLIRADLGGGVSRGALAEILRVGLPSVPATFLYLAYTLIDRQLLAALSGTTAVGLYAVGVRVATIPATLATVVSLAWYPLASRAVHAGSEYSPLFNDALRYVVAGLSLLSLAVALFAREIVAVAAPPAYATAALVAAPLSFAIAVGSFGTITGVAIFVRRRPEIFVATNAAALFVNAAVALAAVPRFGIIGAAVGVLAGQTVWALAQVFIATRLLRELRLRLREPVVTVCVAGGLAAVAGILPDTGSVLSMGLRLTLLLAFVAVLIANGTIRKREWSRVRSAVRGS